MQQGKIRDVDDIGRLACSCCPKVDHGVAGDAAGGNDDSPDLEMLEDHAAGVYGDEGTEGVDIVDPEMDVLEEVGVAIVKAVATLVVDHLIGLEATDAAAEATDAAAAPIPIPATSWSY